jgi:hypothetical protein
VTLDDDLAAALRARMRERGISFKEALNEALRLGLGRAPAARLFRQKTYSLGFRPNLDLDRARELADAIEDEELLRRLERRG